MYHYKYANCSCKIYQKSYIFFSLSFCLLISLLFVSLSLSLFLSFSLLSSCLSLSLDLPLALPLPFSDFTLHLLTFFFPASFLLNFRLPLFFLCLSFPLFLHTSQLHPPSHYYPTPAKSLIPIYL